MLIRNVDGSNDWTFGYGKTNYVKEGIAVGLDIKLRIQEFYQDCFFALPNGIEWERRLGYTKQKELLDADIYRIASETEGVYSIYDFQSEIDGRNYKCKFMVYHQYSVEALPIEFSSEEIWQTP